MNNFYSFEFDLDAAVHNRICALLCMPTLGLLGAM